jgi:signal transduction histidine kinase
VCETPDNIAPIKREGHWMSSPPLSSAVLTGTSGRFFLARIVFIVTGSAALVIALGLFASRSLDTLHAGTEWVLHAQTVRYELSQVLQVLVDMGAGVRRYEVTHDERSFQEAQAAQARLSGELDQLHRTIASDPELQALEAELIAAARQRARQTEELISMERAGDLDAIRRRIERGDTVTVLDTCRSIVARMQDRENQIFERHQKLAGAARDSVAFAIFAITAFAVLMLVLVAYVVFRDATTQRESRRALLESEAALREADQRKDVFLAILSHELRNPLAPIRNAARLLEAPTLTDDELQRSRTIISRQVRHMASLLDDLLDVSRITRGILVLKKEVVSLKGLFEVAIETARPVIDGKRHSLTVTWPADSVQILADPVRLTQVITNLLTNAAKYTDPEGEIRLESRIEEKTIIICVRDNGIGLAPQTLSRVFDMFTQVAPEKGRTDGGLGIGLALVRGLIDLHGGRVEAHSAGLEQGSEFLVYLPNSLMEAAPAVEKPVGGSETASAPLRVLVADDNRDSAESLGMLLELSGHEVFLAHDGVTALALAAEKRPQAVLLDIGMPGMDGYEVAASIRAEPWGSAIKLIAITGWGQEDNKRTAQAAGFDHHLTKPMDSAVLDAILATVARA